MKRLLFVISAGSMAPFGVGAMQMYAIEWDTGDLFKVNSGNGQLTRVGTTGIKRMVDIAFAPNGTLYGFDAGTESKLYKINITTGAATLVAPLGLQAGDFIYEGALTFQGNNAFAMGLTSATTPHLFKINTASGAITNRVRVDREVDINGWYADGEPGIMIGIDRESQKIMAIYTDSGTTAAISAAMPWNVGQVGGMARDGNDIYLASAGPGGVLPGSNSLYKYTLGVGGAPNPQLVGAFNGIGGNGISGIAVVPEPASLIALAAGLCAATLRRRNRRN